MVQHRKAPAYQEYAATLLVNKQFRLMTLAERGLLYTLKLECWENVEIPANEADMAKYLGYDLSELKLALTARVKAFFTEHNGFYTSNELEDYRQHLEDRKAKQSEGGKKGAAKTNKRFKQVQPIDNASENNVQVPRRGSCESLVQYSKDKYSKTQSLDNGDITIDESQQWINDYDEADEELI